MAKGSLSDNEIGIEIDNQTNNSNSFKFLLFFCLIFQFTSNSKIGVLVIQIFLMRIYFCFKKTKKYSNITRCFAELLQRLNLGVPLELVKPDQRLNVLNETIPISLKDAWFHSNQDPNLDPSVFYLLA
ncbi:hypothetical protein BpHYR1_009246 [Brachionus plicatilis]|uniref:Uncharacterized protein n=1 Tax=Brachionus plicatilis TaxID=10195 RepID=A0A3M7P498_BRAPC|nr:hypothetical protein BpHYR1_009246 [Brachionus plicatilis]